MSENILNKHEFNALMKEAGLENKKALAEILDLSYQAVNVWGSTQDYPRYIKPFLQAYAKAKKYDNLVKDIAKSIKEL